MTRMVAKKNVNDNVILAILWLYEKVRWYAQGQGQ